MSSSEASRYLLDVNVLVALTTGNHVHHELIKEWFYASPSLPWAMCAFTEAGFLRNATAVRSGQISMGEATAVLKQLARHPGYCYMPTAADWVMLSTPLFPSAVRHQTGHRRLPARPCRAGKSGAGHHGQGHSPSRRKRTPQTRPAAGSRHERAFVKL